MRRARWHRGWGAALVAGGLVVLAAFFAGGAPGASSSVTVSATVPSSVSLTNGCTAPAAFQLGTVVPGSSALSSTGASVCSFSFQSSNDSAMIRIRQRDGGAGTAMATATNTWTTSGTLGDQMHGVQAYDANLVWAAGSGRVLKRSQDGGATWTTYDTGIGANLYKVMPAPGDPNTWYAVGEARNVIRITSANGATPAFAVATGDLTSSAWPSVDNVLLVAAVSATEVVIAGQNGRIARTTNSGANWTTYQVGTASINDLDFVDASTIYAATGSGVLVTTTGAAIAANWSILALPGYLSAIAVGDASRVYAAGGGGRVYACATAPCSSAANWLNRSDTARVADHITGIDASPSAPSTAIIVSFGVAAKTTNAGVGWTTMPVDTGERLRDVSFSPTGTLAVAVGFEQTAAKSTDLVSFARTNSARSSLYGAAVDPVDGKKGVLVGETGQIRTTTDGGATFTSPTPVSTQPLLDVAYGSSAVAWAVGNAGTIIKSTDGGATWLPQTSGVAISRRLWAVWATSAQEAYAAGDLGTLLHTLNGGTTWTDISLPTTSTLRSVTGGDGGLVIVAGNNTFLRRSTDSGATWTTPTFTGGNITSVDMADAQNGYMVTLYLSNWKTIDGGASWTVMAAPPDEYRTIDAITSNIAYATAGDNGIYATRDGGISWTKSPPPSLWQYDAAGIDGTRAFTGGMGGSTSLTVPAAGATSQVADYGAAPNNWATSGTSLFGVCLQGVSAQTTVNAAAFAVDATAPCTTTDSDPWRAVPGAMTKVGQTTTAGNLGRIDLVWGMRTATNQAPGDYSATVLIEALAPVV